MARVLRGALLLLALARPSVHATRCDETSCDSYCDPLQAAHCSFCSCRTCHHCLHSPGTKGPQRADAESGERKGGTERGPALSDDERRSDAEPGGRALPPAHQRTAQECEASCSALKGSHCSSTKCQGCSFCTALQARTVTGTVFALAEGEEPVALAECDWLAQLTNVRQAAGSFCTRFTTAGRGQ